jgi:hypothetical protein
LKKKLKKVEAQTPVIGREETILDEKPEAVQLLERLFPFLNVNSVRSFNRPINTSGN